MKKYLKYKGVTVNAFGIPMIFSDEKDTGKFRGSKRKYSEYRHFNHNYPNNAPKDLIIVCNISSENRSERDWLRYQLGKFDYILIQKSIWVGPSPLPEGFLRYIKSIGLVGKLKFLELAKPYIKNDKGAR